MPFAARPPVRQRSAPIDRTRGAPRRDPPNACPRRGATADSAARNQSSRGGNVVFKVPTTSGADALLQRDFRHPAERGEAARIDELARRSVRLGRVERDHALIAHHARNNFSEVENRDLAARGRFHEARVEGVTKSSFGAPWRRRGNSLTSTIWRGRSCSVPTATTTTNTSIAGSANLG